MSISVDNLSHLYSPKTPLEVVALKDISLEIEPGEFLAIIGQSGSGKSTLVQHFNGLLKPSSGKIYVEGQDITVRGVNLRLIRQRIGMIFQYPEQQLFEETVFADVAFGPKMMGYPEDDVKTKVKEALSLVGLDESVIGKRSPFQLSGGQKRRVAIAGVLAMQPDYLVLDEPNANLDPKGRDEILFLLEKLNKEKNVTVILVSHSMEEIVRVAKKVALLANGKLVGFGPISQVFSQVEARELPHIPRLMLNLSQKGKAVSTNNFTPKQAAAEILAAIKASREGK